ncbi:MAG: hypothetical protein J3T61_03130 [Candidatus Brocadiales bacterium]|nr:hypothetical protein [Candidatus Bathyanammoxibius sp.]
MIKVWLTKSVRSEEERAITSFPPLDISLEKAIEIFHLVAGRWMSPLGSPPRIQEDSDLPADFHEYRYVILEVPEGVTGWRKGFYLIPEKVLQPKEACELMTQEGWQQDK